MLLKVLLVLLLIGCGREDQQKQQCILYGEECHPSKEEENESEPVVIQGPRGPAGSSGTDGEDGQNGATGEQGPAGTNGVNGLDGSLINFITVCTGGNFPEVLMCVDDKLYAVFDGGPHKDRLVYLPPQTYKTTDDGACLFTVIQECEVQ